MTRRQAFRFVAIAAAAVSIGGTWALVDAQTSPNTPRVPAVASPPAGAVREVYTPMGRFNDQGTGNWMYSVPVETDPEMAKLAEAEAGLAHIADEALLAYVSADKADDQKRLKAELRGVLAKQFDVQRQRRDLELSRIEERVNKLRDQIKKRNDARETIIDRRLEQLTNEADGLGWGQPTGSVVSPQQRALYYGGPAPNKNSR